MPQIVRDNNDGSVTVRRDDGVEVSVPKGSPALAGLDSAIPVATSGQQAPQAFVNPSVFAAQQQQQYQADAPGLASVAPGAGAPSLSLTQGTSGAGPGGNTSGVQGNPPAPGYAAPGPRIPVGPVSGKTPTYGEAAQAYRQSQQDYERGLGRLTTAQQSGSLQEQKLLQQNDADQDQREKSRQMFSAEVDSEKDQALAPYKAAVADFNSYKLDPDRWWKTRSGAQKAMAIASVWITGMGNAKLMAAQALAGGVPQKQSNDAVTAIDKEIEGDIDAQKVEYDKRGKNVSLQGNLYAMNMARLGDKQKAYDLTTSMMQESFKRKLDIVARSTQNEQYAAQADMLAADFGQKSAQGLAKIADDAADNAAKWAQIRAMRDKAPKPLKNEVPNVRVPVINPQTGKQVIDLEIVRDESGNPVAPTQMVDGRTHKPMFNPDGSPIYNEVENRNGAAKQTNSPDQYGVRTVVDPKTKQKRQVLVKATPAYEPFQARDEKEALALGQATAKRDEALNKIDKLEQDQKSFGREVFSTSGNQRVYNTDKLSLLSAWHGMIGINKWTDQVAKRVDNVIPDPGKVWQIAPGPEVYQNMRDMIEQDYQEVIGEAGVPQGAQIGEQQIGVSPPTSNVAKGDPDWIKAHTTDQPGPLYVPPPAAPRYPATRPGAE